MFRIVIYSFLMFLMFGCSSKSGGIQDNFVLFSKASNNRKIVVTSPSPTFIKAEQEEKVKEPKVSTKNIELPKFNNIQFDYKIIPHDRVSIIVYKHPEFSSTTLEGRSRDKGLLVNSKGDIRLPLVKTLHLAGLTQIEAQQKVESAYSKYLKVPDIYLEVVNKRAYIIGEVNSPGEIELAHETLTLLQIISKAGDFKDSADKTKIMILRNGGDRVHSELVNLTDINSLKTANLMIKPNDIVYVLPNNMKIFNKKVSDVSPIVRLIGSLLSPFITLKILSN